MADIKAVLLDVNGTLYSVADAAEPAFRELGLDPALAPVRAAALLHWVLKSLVLAHSVVICAAFIDPRVARSTCIDLEHSEMEMIPASWTCPS